LIQESLQREEEEEKGAQDAIDEINGDGPPGGQGGGPGPEIEPPALPYVPGHPYSMPNVVNVDVPVPTSGRWFGWAKNAAAAVYLATSFYTLFRTKSIVRAVTTGTTAATATGVAMLLLPKVVDRIWSAVPEDSFYPDPADVKIAVTCDSIETAVRDVREGMDFQIPWSRTTQALRLYDQWVQGFLCFTGQRDFVQSGRLYTTHHYTVQEDDDVRPTNHRASEAVNDTIEVEQAVFVARNLPFAVRFGYSGEVVTQVVSKLFNSSNADRQAQAFDLASRVSNLNVPSRLVNFIEEGSAMVSHMLASSSDVRRGRVYAALGLNQNGATREAISRLAIVFMMTLPLLYHLITTPESPSIMHSGPIPLAARFRYVLDRVLRV